MDHANGLLRKVAAAALATAWLLLPVEAAADRIKDLASVGGVRSNQLVGYGLVVGLDGTGDKTGQIQFTVQSLKSMLNRLGVQLPPNINPQLKNVAAVALSATMPAFGKPGQTIDVTASTIGNANSIRGGTLLLSPLRGADGHVYAMAQGNLIVGGFGAATNDGNSISVNVPTVGRIPNGATSERPAPSSFGPGDFLYLNLNRPDFTTAQRMAEAINQALGEGMATPADGSTVRLNAPRDASQRVSYLSFVENLEFEPDSPAAKVIVNSRTGTVVIGAQVEITAAAVAHGNLSVTVSNTTSVSQPVPFGQGDTRVVPNSDISFREEPSRAFLFQPGVTLEEIVRGINQVGAAPSDIVAILEALKEAGALRAELIVI